MPDIINQPPHYTAGSIQCIDAIEAMLGPAGFRHYCLGNVLKYNWRHALKNGAEDLAKAKVYQTWADAGTAAKKPVAEFTPVAVVIASEDGHTADGAGITPYELAMESPSLNVAGADLEA